MAFVNCLTYNFEVYLQFSAYVRSVRMRGHASPSSNQAGQGLLLHQGRTL